MEDHAERMAVAAAEAAYAVAHVYAVHAAHAFYRAVVDGEDDCVALA